MSYVVWPEEARVCDVVDLCGIFGDTRDRTNELKKIRGTVVRDTTLDGFGIVVRDNFDQTPLRYLGDLEIKIVDFSIGSRRMMFRHTQRLADMLTDSRSITLSFYDRQKFFEAQDATFMLMFPQMYSQK